MKRLLVLMLAAALVASSVIPARAGSRGCWEGLAIGLGAVSAYNLFNYGVFAPVVPRWAPAPTVVYAAPPVFYQAPVVCSPPPVYSEPPAYDEDQPRGERAWVPGYWEQSRRWVPGHWEYE